ncbi:MAG: glycosyltransferase family 2 protein [Microbacteriaceae bacterium]|nr:glycosyltransferase family 2 protein [Microbacteriaceae bacterium]
MSARPSVSVIICAYTQKRWDDVNLAISSALDQADTTDVIVVIDHEPELMVRVRQQWPEITVLPNSSRQGLSGARNTGVAASSAQLVAFLDDDATAQPGWLGRMVDVFADPRVVAVGGSAQPRWPAGIAPQTLPVELLWVVGCTYRGQPTERSEVRNVIGCSMAFRRDELNTIGGFNLNTGRVGTIPLGAEETEVCIRLRQADSSRRIIFEPTSRVSHRVTPDRLTWRYLRRRSFFEGISKAALSHSLGASDALSSERSYSTRVLPRGALREIIQGRPLGAAAIGLSLLAASCGYLYGLTRGARLSSAPSV